MPVFGPSRAVQKAMVDALLADAAVASFVGTSVFDSMPASARYPVVTLGPSFDNDQELEGIGLEEHSVQLDVWTRDAGRLGPCKDIVDAVKAALHRQHLSLSGPHAIANVRVISRRVTQDPDGITAHGIVTVLVDVETGTV